MRRLLAAVLCAIALLPHSASAQSVFPNQLPVAPFVVPSDIVIGNHSGTTSQITLSQLWSPTAPIIFSGAGIFGAPSQTYCAQDAGAIAGIACNIPSGSTNGFQFTANGSNVFTVSATGAASFAGTLSATGIASNATGTMPAFVLNNNASSPTTGPLFQLESGGVPVFTVTPSGSFSATGATSNATGTTPAFTFNNSATSPTTGNLVQYQSAGTNQWTVTPSGATAQNGPAQVTAGGSSVQSFVGPTYTTTGAAVSATLHGALGTCTIATGTNPSCTATFSNGAVFASSTSYGCSVSLLTGFAPTTISALPVNVTATSAEALITGTVTTGTTAILSCRGT